MAHKKRLTGKQGCKILYMVADGSIGFKETSDGDKFYVKSVIENTPAWFAGLREGDQLRGYFLKPPCRRGEDARSPWDEDAYEVIKIFCEERGENKALVELSIKTFGDPIWQTNAAWAGRQKRLDTKKTTLHNRATDAAELCAFVVSEDERMRGRIKKDAESSGDDSIATPKARGRVKKNAARAPSSDEEDEPSTPPPKARKLSIATMPSSPHTPPPNATPPYATPVSTRLVIHSMTMEQEGRRYTLDARCFTGATLSEEEVVLLCNEFAKVPTTEFQLLPVSSGIPKIDWKKPLPAVMAIPIKQETWCLVVVVANADAATIFEFGEHGHVGRLGFMIGGSLAQQNIQVCAGKFKPSASITDKGLELVGYLSGVVEAVYTQAEPDKIIQKLETMEYPVLTKEHARRIIKIVLRNVMFGNDLYWAPDEDAIRMPCRGLVADTVAFMEESKSGKIPVRWLGMGDTIGWVAKGELRRLDSWSIEEAMSQTEDESKYAAIIAAYKLAQG